MTGLDDKARQYALKLLSYRGRSEKELAERLRRKGIPATTVSSTVRHLKNVGLIDDVSLAVVLKREARMRKMLSRNGARRYLFDKGIPRDIIDSLFSDDENTDVEDARRFIDRKMKALNRYPAETVKRRLYYLLSRRGYSSETILKVLRHKYITKEGAE